MGHKLP
jgi:CRISPR-associated endonuclease/helicase Cas3